MAIHSYGIWIRETTITTGTGDITLGGAVSGYTPFSSQFSTSDRVLYSITDGANREIGEGTMASATVLERTTPRYTLVAGVLDDTSPTPITLSGSAEVACTDDAEALNFVEQTMRFPAGKSGYVWTADASPAEADWEATVDGGNWT